jgi:putative two-component system response regulator
MTIMRRHAEMGKNIIAPMGEPQLVLPTEVDGAAETQSPMLAMAAKIAASHHERWDGQGYPQKIAGYAIPLEARITSVADVFDALSTRRCYKPAIPLDRCFEIVEEERGRQFDPQVVDACLVARDQFEAAYRELADLETPA